ncbi:MAG: alpha/beta fold hydrolase, partial [Microcoleus sp.]|uniref:alpha/beta fold hydrolase n=1 Tax=Microcoleus sp. TaxID=44472 RepID=UPI003C739ADA
PNVDFNPPAYNPNVDFNPSPSNSINLNGYTIDGNFYREFLKTGGLEGSLGAPKSDQKSLGGNIVQYFEHGHIYWNGSKAIAYQEGTPLPKTSPSNIGAVGVVKPISITAIDDNSSNLNSVKAPFWGTITGNTRLGTKSNNIGLVFADGSSKAIAPSKNTWLVIHGMTNNPPPPDKDVLNELTDNTSLANAVYGYSPDDQVLVLDWRSAAYSTNAYSKIGASWIDSVADWTANLLRESKIPSLNINLVGHSLGSYVAAEIAAKIPGGVNKIIALDPATEVLGSYDFGGGHYSDQVKFSDNSSWSWGFYGSALGSPDRARTADESFNIDFGVKPLWETHGAVENLFTEMLKQAKDKNTSSLGDIFGLDKMNSSEKPWVIDYGINWEAKLIAQTKGDGSWILKDIVPNPDSSEFNGGGGIW